MADTTYQRVSVVEKIAIASTEPAEQAVQFVIEASRRMDKPVAMCGEMAGDPRYTRLLLGLVLFGIGIAMIVLGDFGLPPWDVFHQGLSEQTPLTIGGAVIVVGALLLVSAVSGVEVQTDKMWKAAAGFELPVMIAVNLMDRDRASFGRTVEALQKKYGREVTPLQLPIGEESNFSGVVDLLTGKALTWESDVTTMR